MLNGTFYVAWVLPYLYALKKDEASVVAPLFQLSSVMAFALGFFILGEGINSIQFLGCLLILLGAVGLSLERNLKGFKVKYGVLFLIGISCFFIALSGVIFKFIALEESFWVTSFWESLGIFLSSLVLLMVKSYRQQFLSVLRRNRGKVVALNVANETIVIVGKITLNYATLLAPIAVVYFVSEGFQPFFVLAYGVLLSIFFPKFVSEGIESRKVIQKLVAICVMFAGTYLISFY
ncbi:MAG: EamA family transporter, partial [Patescibacteria group bacterium]